MATLQKKTALIAGGTKGMIAPSVFLLKPYSRPIGNPDILDLSGSS